MGGLVLWKRKSGLDSRYIFFCFFFTPGFGGSGSFGGQSSFGGSSSGPGSSFSSSGNGIGGGGFDPWQVAQPANMAQIQDLQVQCEKDLMRVRVVFDRPFYGMIFSKGHYSNVNCVHVPSGLGQTQVGNSTADTCFQSVAVIILFFWFC